MELEDDDQPFLTQGVNISEETSQGQTPNSFEHKSQSQQSQLSNTPDGMSGMDFSNMMNGFGNMDYNQMMQMMAANGMGGFNPMMGEFLCEQ